MPDERLIHLLALACAASTWAMVGVIWFVQIVHYPLMANVGAAGFVEYQRRHQSQTTLVVAPVMLIELGTALSLAWLRWSDEGLWAWALGGAGLVIAVFGMTFLVQVPLHARLERGFDARIHRRLVISNWVRTVLWTLHGVVALVLAAG